MRLDVIAEFAAGHHGLVTRAAVVRGGSSKRTWYRAITDGRLELVHPGVARLYGTPATAEQQISAAVLACGSSALASHRSAAYLWGAGAAGPVVDVLIPGRRDGAVLDGVVVHRPRDQRDLRPSRRAGIRTTNILRTLCDLGAVAPRAVHRAVGHVISTGIASPRELDAAIAAHSRQGRHGICAFREALADWVVDGKGLDSELEVRMNKLRRRFDLPSMTFHEDVLGYEVDFRIDGTPIILECDGFRFHDQNKANFERDRLRRAELTAAGWIVVNFTWQMLTRQPSWVATKIFDAVHVWAPGVATSRSSR